MMNSNRVLDDVPDVVAAIQHMHANLYHTEDFIFVSSDGRQEFTCHSLVIAMFSAVLQDKIYGPNPCRRIRVEGTEDIAIENIIRYIYDEDIIFESVSDITETKKLADAYCIIGLSKTCIKQLTYINVNCSNVISVLKLSSEFNNIEKESECLSFIIENKEVVFISESFITLEFKDGLNIFAKLRDKYALTEYEFLLFGIQWLETNKSVNKKDLLMNKIDISKIVLNDYLDILVSLPEFFSSTEISHAIYLIRSNEKLSCETVLCKEEKCTHKHTGTNTEKVLGCVYKNAGTNTEKAIGCTYKNAGTNTGKAIGCMYKNAGSNTETAVRRTYKNAESNTEEKTDHENVQHLKKLKELCIQVLDQPERVLIETTDDLSTRGIVFFLCESLKMGFIGSLEKNVVYTFKDLNMSYEGIYYMYKYLQTPSEELSPLQYIELLKATTFFKLEEISFRLVGKIGDVISYDPIFISALFEYDQFKKKCIDLLTSQTWKIILHPNFVNCSADLLRLLLEQDNLNMENELQLLLAIIMWLEARNRQRWHFRSFFLNKIYFENISVKDIQCILKLCPKFFDEKEQKSLLAFKAAEGKKNIRIYQKNLPDWYSLKSRKLKFYKSRYN